MNKLTIFDLHNAMRDHFYDKQPEKYISIDEGWYNLVYDCHNELKIIDPLYRILQIKEKFGLLRFYVQPSEEYCRTPDFDKRYIRTTVEKYEHLSAITCEATGAPGILMKSPTGYLKTLNSDWASMSELYSKYTIAKHSTFDLEDAWWQAIR